jgi:uncharacterized protein (DUF2147 family)
MARGLTVLFLSSVLASAPGHAMADDPPAPTGTWLTEEGDARVEVGRCGEELCGRVVWLEEPLAPEGGVKLDVNNPDERLRDRGILGLEVLRVSRNADADRWTGTIYDPHEGHTYRCNVVRLGDGRLKIRAYVGLPLFGRTTIWSRTAGGD